jgi:hypothetical protein
MHANISFVQLVFGFKTKVIAYVLLCVANLNYLAKSGYKIPRPLEECDRTRAEFDSGQE